MALHPLVDAAPAHLIVLAMLRAIIKDVIKCQKHRLILAATNTFVPAVSHDGIMPKHLPSFIAPCPVSLDKMWLLCIRASLRAHVCVKARLA